MDFFEHQDRAKRHTGRLVALFLAAVLGIIAALYVALLIAAHVAGLYVDPQGGGEPTAPEILLWRPEILLAAGVLALLTVGLGSMTKIGQLRGGGRVVAEQLDGDLIDGETTDPSERRILNVVEEMAIASGVPTPPVYLMRREPGINAFAAGYAPDDAVVGLTAGAAEHLSRDELQGVIAHEFSHILNGDMRLNIRLIGLVHGILVLGLVGYGVMRVVGIGGRGAAVGVAAGRSRGRGKGGGAVIAILIIAIALIVIGFIGSFFGSLIKASISRQREYLADASAVQFTRNPGGIAGALKKIAGLSRHSEVRAARAGEISHMFFGRHAHREWAQWLSTHPPLLDRIRRIDPTFDGRIQPVAEGSAAGAPPPGASGFAGGGEPGWDEAGQTPPALAMAGQPDAAHVRQAERLLAAVGPGWRRACRNPHDARAVVLAMLIDPEDQAVRRTQFERLAALGEPSLERVVRRLDGSRDRDLPRAAVIPLLDLALPQLRRLTRAQYEAFKRAIAELAQADDRIDLFEWMLKRMVLRHLEPSFGGRRRARGKFTHPARLATATTRLLSVLAAVGTRSEREQATAFAAGVAVAGLPGTTLPARRASLQELGAALDQLETLKPAGRRRLLEAAAATIASDREVTIPEAELFRAVADQLDVPVSPLLPGQALA